MIFIGDYFALALVLVLALFFLDTKSGIRHMTVTSKLFIASLLMTAITALTDLFTGYPVGGQSKLFQFIDPPEKIRRNVPSTALGIRHKFPDRKGLLSVDGTDQIGYLRLFLYQIEGEIKILPS